ncbi:alkanesulfonate ABC transporter permease [Klebsiella pneumoniae]|nr:alkanesulfonate ABC transporter permease [Klebsiella pneumoniae]
MLVAPIYWKYTATLELWERPLLLPHGVITRNGFVGSSLLDIALNKEWPKA